MLRNLRSISLVCLLNLIGMNAFAQQAGVSSQATDVPAQGTLLVDSIGATNRYNAMIELPKAYLSGVCIIKRNEEGNVVGCLFNEFGISALEFAYRPGDKKVKLLSVIQMMNKWYIKRIISRDLARVYQGLQKGETTYHNEKYHITYKFTPMIEKASPEGCEDVRKDIEITSNDTDATEK